MWRRLISGFMLLVQLKDHSTSFLHSSKWGRSSSSSGNQWKLKPRKTLSRTMMADDEDDELMDDGDRMMMTE